jgi:DNA repair protein RAD50
MKQHANHVSRTQKELERLKQEIINIETDLSATGSTKTADDVQLELDALSDNM